MLAISCGKGGDDPVKGTPVAKVTLDQTSLELYAGDTYTFSATVEPEDATDKTLTWSSTKPAVATIDNDGKVTAVAEGEAIITAKSKNNITASCTITVEPALTDETDITAKFDADFAKALKEKGYISDASKITYGDVKGLDAVNVADCSLASLAGLQYFKALQKLWASGNDISEIDVSRSPDLYYLGIMDCKNLTSVNVSNNPKLYNLACNNSPITSLDLSKTVALGNLYVENCRLTSLDISQTKVYATAQYKGNPGKDGWFVVTYPEDGYSSESWEYEGKTVTSVFRKASDPDAKSLSFDCGSEITMERAEKLVVRAAFEPANAAFQAVEWSSDDEDVVMVFKYGDGNLTGRICAMQSGTATVTAKAAVSGIVSKIKVTVTEKPNHVAFDGHSGEDDKAQFLTWFGKELDLKAKVSPEGLPLTVLDWDWNNPNRAHEECVVEHNVTADKATVTSYWTTNVTMSGIDVTARVKSDASKVAYAHVAFRTVCWIEYENDYGKIQSEHGFAYVEGGVDNWKYVWRADLYPTAIYFAAYCPPLDYSDLVVPSRYYPDAYIPTSEYTLTVSKDDAKLVKITKADGDKYYKIEPLATKTTSVELIYTCGKFVQRFALDIIK